MASITKKAAVQMGEMIREDHVPAARKVTAFVGTWMGRSGTSIALQLQSSPDGERIVVHKWDDEDTCSVRHIKGNFWKNPAKAVEYANIPDVDFATYNIGLVIVRDLGIRP